MGRGLLAGLGAGGIVSVLGLGALSALTPLPPETGASRTRGPAAEILGAAGQGPARAAPRPLAMPEPVPAAAAVPDRNAEPAAEARAPVAVPQIPAPQTPELALPQIPQSDPMATDPVAADPVTTGSVDAGPGAGGRDTEHPAAPVAQTDLAVPVVAPLEDSVPATPVTAAAPIVALPQPPDRPAPVDPVSAAAPATETDPALWPGEIAAPERPAAPVVVAEDGRPADESAVPVPPPGEARAPELFPAAGVGPFLRPPGGEILLVPGASVGPVRLRAASEPAPDPAGSVAP